MLLTDLPTSGVVRLSGTSAAAIGLVAERHTPGDRTVPVVVFPGLSRPVGTAPSDVIDDLLRRVTAVAIAQFPAWLPDPAAAPQSGGALDRIAARAQTHRHDGAPGLGNALGLLGTAAVRRDALRAFTTLPAADRRDALNYALAASYGATRLVLAVELDAPLDTHQVSAVSTAAAWFARDQCAVWLFGPDAAQLTRFPEVDGPDPLVGGDDEPATTDTPLGTLRPAPSYPPLSGRPHPASAAEHHLEGALSGAAWAAERTWNRTVDLGNLHPVVRVDLLFPQVKLVVEVDGPDHRGAAKYEADRRRDADLMLAGYRVLRLTNSQILGDLAVALSIIQRLVAAPGNAEGGNV